MRRGEARGYRGPGFGEWSMIVGSKIEAQGTMGGRARKSRDKKRFGDLARVISSSLFLPLGPDAAVLGKVFRLALDKAAVNWVLSVGLLYWARGAMTMWPRSANQLNAVAKEPRTRLRLCHACIRAALLRNCAEQHPCTNPRPECDNGEQTCSQIRASPLLDPVLQSSIPLLSLHPPAARSTSGRGLAVLGRKSTLGCFNLMFHLELPGSREPLGIPPMARPKAP